MSFRQGNLLFLSLLCYSAHGGIQRFNQRVLRVLAEHTKARALVLKDPPQTIPSANSSIQVQGFGGRRLPYVVQAVQSAFDARLLLIDHINLLPLAFIAKLLRPRLKILMFAHGVEVWDDPAFRKKRFYEPALLRIAISRVCIVSAYSATLFSERYGYPNDRIRILPNAVDPVNVPTPAPSTKGANLLTVTRLGRGEQSKHVDKIIAAVSLMREAVPGVRLEVIGDGELRWDLEALSTKLGVQKHVCFLGRATDEELSSAYARARVFVLPSTKEGFGIVFLEAWLHNLPVVGAKGGALPEVIADQQDGLLVNPSDVDALAGALTTLLTDGESADAMALAGRVKVRERFLQSHFASGLNATISNLTGAEGLNKDDATSA